MTDFMRPVKDPYGVYYKLDNEEITIGRLCVLALSSQIQGEVESVEDKIKRGNLAIAIGQHETDGKSLFLSDEEKLMLRDRVARTFASAALVSAILDQIDEQS